MTKLGCGIATALVAAALVGCGDAALRAAERGDYAKLRAEIAQKHGSGSLSNGEARDLARAVAEREIETAKQEKDAEARLRETRACSTEIDDALAERMKTHDGAGAEAALERLEDGSLGDGSARDYLGDADDRWRAVGARTLHRDGDAKRRREAIVDPSPRVRRSAIHASAEAKDAGDLDLLFETARVDPDLLLRNEALRAMSAIVRGSDAGRARAGELALRLRDLWTSGDDAVREDVAVAWALAPVFESGGREALRVAIAEGKGPGALAAAGVVLRTAPKDQELRASAEGLLARTIDEGSRRDRLHAVAVARPEGIVLDALRRASKEDDLDVRVPALARLLDAKSDRDGAQKELERVAGYGVRGAKTAAGEAEDARLREHASRARTALAQAGDVRIQAWIEQDLTSQDPHRRASAASALAAMGRAARAAPLLADADASVRTRAACTLLVAARR